MTRKLKALGLGLMAAFAFSALAASVASGANHHFNSTAGGEIESIALNSQVFESTTGEGKGYECDEVDSKSEVKEATATSVTAETIYTDCESFNPTAVVEIRTNGCHDKLTGATTQGNPTGGEHATIHHECFEGKAMEIRATGLKLKCSSIGSQEVADAVHYQTVETPGGATHVRLNTTAHGTDSKTEGVCGEGTHDNGGMTGDKTLTTPGGSIDISTT